MVIGVSSIVVMMSLGVGIRKATMESYENMGSLTNITVSSWRWVENANGNGSSTETKLDKKAVETMRQIPGVVAVMPQINAYGIIKSGKWVADTSILAVDGEVAEKFGKPRKTEIIELAEETKAPKEDLFFENYNCRIILTKGGYFKKLSVQAARATEEYKLKEGDFIIYQEDTDNRGDILFFTDKGQIYRARVDDFELGKANQMGEYVPTKLNMDDDEHVVACKMIYELNPDHHMVYIFENGKGLRVNLSAYEAKTRRRKITGAYSTDSPLAGAVYEGDKPVPIFIRSDGGRGMLIKSDLIPVKATRTAAGVQIMKIAKKGVKIDLVTDRIEDVGKDALKCKKLALPSNGTLLAQLTFNF